MTHIIHVAPEWRGATAIRAVRHIAWLEGALEIGAKVRAMLMSVSLPLQKRQDGQSIVVMRTSSGRGHQREQPRHPERKSGWEQSLKAAQMTSGKDGATISVRHRRPLPNRRPVQKRGHGLSAPPARITIAQAASSKCPALPARKMSAQAVQVFR